jgi:transmembrane sensor
VEEAYIYSLLKKFVTEDLSDAELLVFKEIVGNEEYAPVIDRLMDSEWETLKPGIDFSKLQAEILYQKIISDQRYVDRAKQKPRQLRTLTAKLLWAACFCMVVTSVILTIYNYHKPASTVYLFYKAPLGQRISRFLPDGSKVWINAGSTVRITKNFDGKTREVFLQGEAFFDVVHKDKIPFVIHTGSITTQVLGTAFNIRAYPQKDINIIVLRGLVGVKGRHGLLGLIKPDQQLTYDQKTEISSSGEINARLFTSWMRNELQLNNVNMAEAAETLARWYNVKIVFDDASLKNGSFTASFSAGTPLRQVMGIISKINRFNYKLSADTVYISRSAAVQ